MAKRGRSKHESKKRRERSSGSPTHQQLLRQLGALGTQIGKAGETRVWKAFHHSRKKTRGIPPWVLGYRRATKQEDQRGVDGFVFTPLGEIPIQIKTSVHKKQSATSEDFAEQPDIPTVYLTLRESDIEIRRLVTLLVTPYYERLQSNQTPMA